MTVVERARNSRDAKYSLVEWNIIIREDRRDSELKSTIVEGTEYSLWDFSGVTLLPRPCSLEARGWKDVM